VERAESGGMRRIGLVTIVVRDVIGGRLPSRPVPSPCPDLLGLGLTGPPAGDRDGRWDESDDGAAPCPKGVSGTFGWEASDVDLLRDGRDEDWRISSCSSINSVKFSMRSSRLMSASLSSSWLAWSSSICSACCLSLLCISRICSSCCWSLRFVCWIVSQLRQTFRYTFLTDSPTSSLCLST